MRRIAIVVLTALTLVSCKKKLTEDDVLPLNVMKVVLWDMNTADTWFNQISNTDSLHKTRKMNIQLYEQVFVSNKTTKKQFYTSYQYYQTKPDKMKTLMDSVVAYGERVKNSYKGPKKY
jgi:Domain of unknown function (DUF4296)